MSIDDIIERNITGDIVYSGTYRNLSDGLFQNTSITSFTSDTITGAELGRRSFSNCNSLLRVSMPNLSIGSNTMKMIETFYNCSNLKSVYLPRMATNWGTGTFESCSNLTDVNINSCVTLPQSTFRYCYALEKIDLPNCTRMYNTAFGACRSLTTVILRSQTVCAINHVNVFENTHLRGYGGTFSGHVYVPSSLISSYQTASNWSTLYANYPDIFRAIEGSEYE